MKRKMSIGLILFIFILFGSGLTASQAAPILDQSHAYYNYNQYNTHTNRELAQTFTVGANGLLTSVEVYITKSPMGAAADLVFEVRSDGPGGSVLASDIYLQSAPGGMHWKSFDVSSAGIWVTTGQTYAIHLDVSNNTPYGWHWGGAVIRPADTVTGRHMRIPVPVGILSFLRTREGPFTMSSISTSVHGWIPIPFPSPMPSGSWEAVLPH